MPELQLKDGSKIEIRRMQRRDVMGLYQVASRVFREGTSMLSSQLPFTPNEMEREFLSVRESEQVTFVADKDGRIVGWIRADRRQVPFMRHIATIWLGMEQDIRGLGLGELFIQQVIQWAREQKIEKIELGLRSSNTTAKRLYQKLGFVEEGRKLRAIKTEQGYEDDIWMSLFLDETAVQRNKSSAKSTGKAKKAKKARA